MNPNLVEILKSNLKEFHEEVSEHTLKRKEINKLLDLHEKILDLENLYSLPLEIKENLDELKKFIGKPLKIDSSHIDVVNNDLIKAIRDLCEIVKQFDSIRILNEMEFLCKRMTKIESLVEKLLNDGLKRKVDLQFHVDGYELVKKPISYDPSEPVINPEDSLRKLMNSFSEREQECIYHHFGLFGHNKLKLGEIGSIFKISEERIRQILSKIKRKLQHPSRQKLMKDIPLDIKEALNGTSTIS